MTMNKNHTKKHDYNSWEFHLLPYKINNYKQMTSMANIGKQEDDDSVSYMCCR